MLGIRFGMASNDGSWFAAFRCGTPPGASRVVIYIRYIPGTRLGLLQGFRVTYVATWREKTIFEDISSSPIARWSRTREGCLFRRERRQISPTERILKSRLNDFHGTCGAGEVAEKKRKDGCLLDDTRRQCSSFTLLCCFLSLRVNIYSVIDMTLYEIRKLEK